MELLGIIVTVALAVNTYVLIIVTLHMLKLRAALSSLEASDV